MAQVKGIAILGLIKFIKKYHKNELDKIVKALPAESAKYMEEHILITKWYPYKLYTDLLRTYDSIIGKGDLSTCIEQGRLSAKNDLSTVYKIFVSFIDIELLIGRAMSIWNSYYDTGTVEANLISKGEVIITIKGFPDIDIAHVKNAQGWLEQFLTMCKVKNVKSTIVKCQCYGDPFTELQFTGER
jgi:hypothetical protein